MSNFDFLKEFNRELYELALKLEDDVINSPRAVPADATLFLETLVEDIYRLSNKKLESNVISFYKKIDYLYRSGVITYIYKNKLQDAYNLRNFIHKNYKDNQEESVLALDLHKRLYYISKKYFRDFCDNYRYINIPDYRPPTQKEVLFDNCIICGCENNNSLSNMCVDCNLKIETANYIINIKNSISGDVFSKRDLNKCGIGEFEANSLLMTLTKENLIFKNGDLYTFNDDEVKIYLKQSEEFVNVGLLLDKFYNDEITPVEVKKSIEYWKGSKNQKNFTEFYRLINNRLVEKFQSNLLKTEDLKKSIKSSTLNYINIKEWFNEEREFFIEGHLNDAFILFNELLIKKYFEFKKRGMADDEIKKELHIFDEIYDFWINEFMVEEFFKKTNDIKRELIIREIKKDKSLSEALRSIDLSKKEFNKLYRTSKDNDDEFYHLFNREYVQKRQKMLIKNLKGNTLNKAIKKTKITKKEFWDWYLEGELEINGFYISVTGILMDKYLKLRKSGWNKSDILRMIGIDRDILKSWEKNQSHEIFEDFKNKNNEITATLLKRGQIINALKEDKTLDEALKQTGISAIEFDEIYSNSKKEKSDFHRRFDYELLENKKRQFARILEDNDFYNTIQKSNFTQKEFNDCYIKDQNSYLANAANCETYVKVTRLLMDKYISARMAGKNKPDSARSVGLSNLIIDKWLKNSDYGIFSDFADEIRLLNIELISKNFKDYKSKSEVHEICDIPIKTIDNYIEYGKSGFMDYKEIYELYENHVIPKQIEIFLNDIRSKPLKKSLKHSKFTPDEFSYYYDLGKSGNEKFRKFYEKYLDIKINLYVESILSNKSPKIALKNSYLTKDEFKTHESEINQIIFDKRLDLILDEIIKNESTGVRLANIVGVDVDEIYEWYFKGKSGDKKYHEFATLFELGVIAPRIVPYKHALDSGFPKNFLIKRIKKDIGAKDFRIWERHDILNWEFDNLIYADIDESEQRIRKFLENSDFVKEFEKIEDSQLVDFFKKLLKGTVKITGMAIEIPKRNNDDYREEISGK